MMSIKKYGKVASFGLTALLSIGNIESRIFETTLPYMTGYFYPDLSNPKQNTDDESNESNSLMILSGQFALYNRYANEAFGKYNINDKQNLSYLFNGKDDFIMSELFQDGEAPQEELVKYFDNITLYPEYSLEEHGAILGFAAQAETCCANRDIRFHFNARLPIKTIEIQNPKGLEAIQSNVEAAVTAANNTSGNTDLKTSVTLDSTNKTFVASLSYLKDKGIIDIKNGNPSNNYVINPFAEINASDEKDGTTSTPIKIKIDTILSGKIIKGDVSKIVLNNAAGTDFALKPSVTNGLTVLPLDLYSINSNKDFYIVGTDLSLSTSPAILTTKKTTEKVQVGNVIDGKNITITSSNAIPITSGIDIDILGHPAKSTYSQFNNSYVDFQNPPVYVVKSTNIPTTTFYKFAPVEHIPDANTGTYPDYQFNVTPDVAFVKSDSTFNTTIKPSTTTGLSNFSSVVTDKPGIFWSTEDYTDMPADDIYIITSLDQNYNPTTASKLIFEKINDQLIADTTEEEVIDIIFTDNFLNGSYTSGSVSSSTSTTKANWNSFKKQGLGDLDLEIGVGSTWFCGNLLTDLLFGIVIPTSAIIDNPINNYLAVPLGNNGHYEIRGGLQGTYEFNDWASLSTYGAYSWALPAYEEIIPSFKGATAFGLLPTKTKAEISWQQLVVNADLMMYPYYCCGIDLGYQFMWKREDKFCGCFKTANNGVGDLQTIDFDVMKPYTKRVAHKLKMSLFCDASDFCQFSMGLAQVLGGKNVALEKDYFISLMVLFD